MWLFLWIDEASYRNDECLFETKAEAIEFVLDSNEVQNYVESGDTLENVKTSLEKFLQYPTDDSKFYGGTFYFKLCDIRPLKKIDGKWICNNE